MYVGLYAGSEIRENSSIFNGVGGRGGIRTHGTLAGTPVFKTGALNHSATLPVLEFHPLSSAFPRTQRDSGTCLDQRTTESCAKSIWSGRFDGGGAAQGAESMMPS